MPSIKDSAYTLPVITPLRKVGNLSTGANNPMLIRGVDARIGDRSDFVVKLNQAGRMGGGGAMRELIAAFIAMEMDLPVALPAVIDISSDFLDLLRGEPDFEVASKSVGVNFGTFYREKFAVQGVHQKLPNTLHAVAGEVLAFDLLIQNADRTHELPGKPNLTVVGKELLIFDHEAAFGFIFDLPSNRNPEPWNIRQSDLVWIKKHTLLRRLEGFKYNQEDLVMKIARLDPDFWERAWNLTPPAWRNSDQFGAIRTYIKQIVDNRIIFAQNLQKLFL